MQAVGLCCPATITWASVATKATSVFETRLLTPPHGAWQAKQNRQQQNKFRTDELRWAKCGCYEMWVLQGDNSDFSASSLRTLSAWSTKVLLIIGTSSMDDESLESPFENLGSSKMAWADEGRSH